MSAEIINLRQARKAKERREADALAEENRAKFGRSKAERKVTQAEQDLEARRLEAQRREHRDNDDESSK
jgi:hypothetical protein